MALADYWKLGSVANVTLQSNSYNSAVTDENGANVADLSTNTRFTTINVFGTNPTSAGLVLPARTGQWCSISNQCGSSIYVKSSVNDSNPITIANGETQFVWFDSSNLIAPRYRKVSIVAPTFDIGSFPNSAPTDADYFFIKDITGGTGSNYCTGAQLKAYVGAQSAGNGLHVTGSTWSVQNADSSITVSSSGIAVGNVPWANLTGVPTATPTVLGLVKLVGDLDGTSGTATRIAGLAGSVSSNTVTITATAFTNPSVLTWYTSGGVNFVGAFGSIRTGSKVLTWMHYNTVPNLVNYDIGVIDLPCLLRECAGYSADYFNTFSQYIPGVSYPVISLPQFDGYQTKPMIWEVQSVGPSGNVSKHGKFSYAYDISAGSVTITGITIGTLWNAGGSNHAQCAIRVKIMDNLNRIYYSEIRLVAHTGPTTRHAAISAPSSFSASFIDETGMSMTALPVTPTIVAQTSTAYSGTGIYYGIKITVPIITGATNAVIVVDGEACHAYSANIY